MNSSDKNNIQLAVVVAGVVIYQDGKYLLVQENHVDPNVHGKWNLPAGRVDVGDTLEQTAVKEAKEETGFDVRLLGKIDIFQSTATVAVKHAYEAQIISGELNPPPEEILDAKWVNIDEVRAMQEQNHLRSGWVLGAIEIIEERGPRVPPVSAAFVS